MNFSLFLLFSRPQKKDVSSHKKHTRLWQKFLSLSLSFYLWDRARARRTGGEDEEEREEVFFFVVVVVVVVRGIVDEV